MAHFQAARSESDGNDYIIAGMAKQGTGNTIYELSNRLFTNRDDLNLKFTPFSTIPYWRDTDFIAQDSLHKIRKICAKPASRAALVGIGGVGKSQVAIEYAYQLQDKSPTTSVFWVHAGTQATFEEGYRRIAEATRMDGWDNPNIDVLRLVHSWLCDESNGKWVLIIDNANDSNVFFPPITRSQAHRTGVLDQSVAPFLDPLPHTLNGSILITSRNRDLAFRLTGSLSSVFMVKPMDQTNALALFQKKIYFGAHSDDALKLVQYLGCMPLAITQAAAYIWKEIPTAAKLLLLKSLFGGQGIPKSLHHSQYEQHNDKKVGFANFKDDVHTLINNFLVKFSAERGVFEMHRPVQFSTMKWLELIDERKKWMKTYVRLIDVSFSKRRYGNWAACQALFPHGQAAVGYRPTNIKALEAWASVTVKAAWYASEIGQYELAEKMSVSALHVREETLGAEHHHTLGSISQLGLVLQRQGKYEEAEAMQQRALEGRENMLGPEHSHTLISMANLVSTYINQGRWKEAEELGMQVVKTRKRVLGEEHPDTLSSVTILALVSKCYAGPQPGFEEASTHGGTTVGGYESNLTGQTFAQHGVFKTDVEEPTGILISEQLKYDDEIRSLISDEDSDKSQTSTPNPIQSNGIENAIVSLLATNSMLTPLYCKALQFMAKEQFVNNFRRLLEVFYDDLNTWGESAVTRELAALLRSRKTRSRMADKITDKQISTENRLREEDLAPFQGLDKTNFAHLEGWLAKGNFPPPLDALENSDVGHHHEGDTSSYESESDMEEERKAKDHSRRIEMAQFPRLEHVIQALIEGRPFQNMLIGFKEFLLPHGLLNEILSIPRESITYDSKGKHTFLNTIQGLLEDTTALEWDWWPLSPRIRPLGHHETRVYWQCFCGTVRWRELKPGQKEILEDLLDQRPAKLLHSPLCASIKSSRIERRVTEAPLNSGQVGRLVPSYTSSARQKYAPNPGSSSSGNNAPPSQPGNSIHSMQSTPVISHSGHAPLPNGPGPNKQSWVIFGAEGPRITIELDQIGNNDLGCDPKFLRKLRRRHQELRGWFRMYFSFWRLSYWEFVKFERIPLQPGRIVVQKVDLPNSGEYEYSPRPPDVTVEHPGISRHEFEIIVRLCIAPCLFSSFRMLHDCVSIKEDAKHIIDRLPKKDTEFRVNVQDQREKYVWGIQARYAISATRVVVIHVVILGVSFGAWIWWQRKHPDDIQGASVPLTVAGILISTFWSSTGVLRGLR